MAAAASPSSSPLSSSPKSASPTLSGRRITACPAGRLPAPRILLPSLSISGRSGLLQLCRTHLPHWRCAATAGPPPPPFGDDDGSGAGLEESLYKTQDAVRIFFAVLLWMSLFFWGSACDGRNDTRPNKRSR